MLQVPLIPGLMCLLQNSRVYLCCFVANDVLESFSLYYQEAYTWLCQNSALNKEENTFCICKVPFLAPVVKEVVKWNNKAFELSFSELVSLLHKYPGG